MSLRLIVLYSLNSLNLLSVLTAITDGISKLWKVHNFNYVNKYYEHLLSFLFYWFPLIVYLNSVHSSYSLLQYILLYHHLNYTIMIGPTRVMWCAKINNVAWLNQCSVMFPLNMVQTMWHHAIVSVFGLTTVLGRSIRMLLHRAWYNETNIDC